MQIYRDLAADDHRLPDPRRPSPLLPEDAFPAGISLSHVSDGECRLTVRAAASDGSDHGQRELCGFRGQPRHRAGLTLLGRPVCPRPSPWKKIASFKLPV
jgi:hypothetical protein